MHHNLISNSSRLDRRKFLQLIGATSTISLGWGSGLTISPAWGKEEVLSGKQLKILSKVPPNAEPELEDLIQSWITPVKHFYVRSHAPTPQIDVERYRLSVEGLVEKPLNLSLAELTEQFPQKTVVSTMTCAGNRRSEHSRVKKVNGVQWESGAIGNARWGGVPLSALLKKAGIKEGAKHVWFEGSDAIERDSGTIPFGGSIPLEKALGDTETMPGALVVSKMNGQPLPPDHGYPVRAVVPGYIGARSVKWLGRIVVSDRPSNNHYLSHAYKIVTEDDEKQWQAASPIYQFPINSVIAVPKRGADVSTGKFRVQGYALPPGAPGRTIQKVEISCDGGRSWTQAKLTGPKRQYCWQLWQADVSINSRTKALIARATDSAGNVQPQSVDWNMKGYLFNSWYRTPVQVDS